MAEITEDQPHYNTLSTIVREEKGYVAHNVWKYASVLPNCSIEGIELYEYAIDTYFNSSYKNGIVF
jgi:hypothetical protein